MGIKDIYHKKQNELWLIFLGLSLFSKIEQINALFIQQRNLKLLKKRLYQLCAITHSCVEGGSLFFCSVGYHKLFAYASLLLLCL